MKKLIVVCLPGIFNTGEGFFGHWAQLFSGHGIKPFFCTFPFRGLPFGAHAPAWLGYVTLQEDVDFVVRRVGALRRTYPDAQIICLGHSRGALVGALAQQKRPGLFHGMILMAPSLPYGLMPTGITLRRFLAFLPYSLKGGWNCLPIRRTFWGSCISAMNGLPKDVARACHRKMVWESGTIIETPGINPPEVGRETFRDTPTIMIGHQNDKLIPADRVRKWVRLIGYRHVGYVETDGCHYAIHDPRYAGDVIKSVLHFLGLSPRLIKADEKAPAGRVLGRPVPA